MLNIFYGCCGLAFVTIPNSVTSIRDYAFQDCSGLTSVTIPNSMTSIGVHAFYGTNLKKTIWLTNTPPSGYTNAAGAVNYVANEQYTDLSNKTVYPFLSSIFEVDGVKYVPVSPSERTCDAIDCVFDSTVTHTKILSTVTYRGITMNVLNIKPYVCYNNKYIEVVELDYVGNIPNYALANCTNLKSAVLSKGFTSIDDYAFANCSELQSFIIPDSTRTIGNNAFQNCESIPLITIPKTTTDIKDNVFNGCTGLKTVLIEDREAELKLGSNGNSPLFSSCPLDSVYIGGNITYSTSQNKGYSPFYHNTTLRSVTITDKETEISPNEFYGCTNLQNVRIGDGVTTIGDWAFSGCFSLSYFAFGTQVNSIGKEAFSDCTNVGRIISKATTPPLCGSQALDDINKWNCQLLVPKGCLSAYQAADQWKEFFFVDENAQEEGNVEKADVNGDGVVDVADIATIIDVMAGGTGINNSLQQSADVNGDGVVDVADIATIISEMAARARMQEEMEE